MARRNKPLVFISTLLIFILACTLTTAPNPTQTAFVATETEIVATTTAQSSIPIYAGGIQWKDINGKVHTFMVEDPPMDQYQVDFVSWAIDIPNTTQKIHVLRHGDPRGLIFVGVWSYIHADDANLLVDIAVMGVNDSGVAVKNLTVSVLDQTAPNMELSQLKFSLDLIGTSTNIQPVGFDCTAIPSDPEGNLSETDGSSVFVAFMCQPSSNPLG